MQNIIKAGVLTAMLTFMCQARADDENAAVPLRDPLDTTPLRLQAAPLSAMQRAGTTTGREFNPAISVIIDGTYAHISDELEDPPGFELGEHSHAHGHDHSHGIEKGFQLREVELTMTGSVDPYFDALLALGFSPDNVEIEEAYVSTRMLPGGLRLKAGKFLSDVGYLNKQHTHDWLFADAPWMHEYMFGDDGLNEIGLQLSWLPPTDIYLRLGVEVLQGQSEGVANYIGPGRHEIVTMLPDDGRPQRVRWRADNELRERDGPRLFTGFAKLAPDIGMNHAVQFGTFGGYSRAYQHEDAHSSGRLETWDGDAWFAGADAVYKYDGQGVMGHRNLTLQAEYMYRRLNLDYRSRQFENFDTLAVTDANRQHWKQDGLYAQAVYGFAPRWNAGVRLDVLGLTNEGYEDRGTPTSFGQSYRYTGQLSYAPTEFSRLRLQTSYIKPAHEDDHGHDHDHEDAWMIVLQYTMSLGVHGAHAF